ncbi:MAG: hypothetical protein K0R24_2032, partial [Gammaproteobacteria bacterium]|nr:hypothetical protein [Gammaproteobacteria bacterium]
MAMRNKMNFGEFTVVSDKTGAQEELTRQMKGILAEQEKTIERLRKEGEVFEKEARAFDEEGKLAESLTQKIQQLGHYMKKANEMIVEFNQQVLKRGELMSVLFANIKTCALLRGEELAQHFIIAQASFDEVSKAVEAEEITLDQLEEVFNLFKEVINQMKAELDKVALTNQSLYDKNISDYHEACTWLENLKLKLKPSLDYRDQNNETGESCAGLLDIMEAQIAKEKASNLEEKDSSPEKTPPLSPKDPSIAKTSSESSGDEHSPVSSTTARLQSAMNQPPAAAARNAPKMPAVVLTSAASQQQKPIVGAASIPQGALAAGSLYKEKEKEAAGKKQGKQEADKAVKKEKCAL